MTTAGNRVTILALELRAMLTKRDSIHPFPACLPVFLLLLVLAVGTAGAQQDNGTVKDEESDAGQTASQADSAQRAEDREFQPSEKISADDAVSFPVDI